MADAFYPFVENPAPPETPQEAPDEQRLTVDHPARIAVYDDAAAAPRVVVVAPSDVRTYLEEITKTVSALSKEQGGQIPFTVIRECVENLIHAYFSSPTVSILDAGNTIRFSDLGPGIQNKALALEYGTSSATEEMKRYIRGVGSGLPYASQYMEDKGGTLSIEDNIGGGCVVTISLATRPAPLGQSGQAGAPWGPGAPDAAGIGQPGMGASMGAGMAQPGMGAAAQPGMGAGMAAGMTVGAPAGMPGGAWPQASGGAAPYGAGAPYPGAGQPGWPLGGYPSPQAYGALAGYPAYPAPAPVPGQAAMPGQAGAAGWPAQGTPDAAWQAAAGYGPAPASGWPQAAPFSAAEVPGGAVAEPPRSPSAEASWVQAEDEDAVLSGREKQALSYLLRHETCGPKELAEAFGSSTATWSRCLANLGAGGFAQKNGQKYHATPLGRLWAERHLLGIV